MHPIAISLGYGQAELSRVPPPLTPVFPSSLVPVSWSVPPRGFASMEGEWCSPAQAACHLPQPACSPPSSKARCARRACFQLQELLLFFLLILLTLQVGIVPTLRTQVGFMEEMKHWLNTLLSGSISPWLFMQSFNLSCLKPSGRTFAWMLLTSCDFCPRIWDVQGLATSGSVSKGSTCSCPAPVALCERQFV